MGQGSPHVGRECGFLPVKGPRESLPLGPPQVQNLDPRGEHSGGRRPCSNVDASKLPAGEYPAVSPAGGWGVGLPLVLRARDIWAGGTARGEGPSSGREGALRVVDPSQLSPNRCIRLAQSTVRRCSGPLHRFRLSTRRWRGHPRIPWLLYCTDLDGPLREHAACGEWDSLAEDDTASTGHCICMGSGQ